jgi:hypothetical protein
MKTKITTVQVRADGRHVPTSIVRRHAGAGRGGGIVVVPHFDVKPLWCVVYLHCDSHHARVKYVSITLSPILCLKLLVHLVEPSIYIGFMPKSHFGSQAPVNPLH